LTLPCAQGWVFGYELEATFGALNRQHLLGVSTITAGAAQLELGGACLVSTEESALGIIPIITIESEGDCVAVVVGTRNSIRALVNVSVAGSRKLDSGWCT